MHSTNLSAFYLLIIICVVCGHAMRLQTVEPTLSRVRWFWHLTISNTDCRKAERSANSARLGTVSDRRYIPLLQI